MAFFDKKSVTATAKSSSYTAVTAVNPETSISIPSTVHDSKFTKSNHQSKGHEPYLLSPTYTPASPFAVTLPSDPCAGQSTSSPVKRSSSSELILSPSLPPAPSSQAGGFPTNKVSPMTKTLSSTTVTPALFTFSTPSSAGTASTRICNSSSGEQAQHHNSIVSEQVNSD